MSIHNSTYLKHNGLICPACKSHRVEPGSDENWEGTIIHKPAHCTECHAQWDEIYRLEGYTGLIKWGEHEYT